MDGSIQFFNQYLLVLSFELLRLLKPLSLSLDLVQPNVFLTEQMFSAFTGGRKFLILILLKDLGANRCV